jgi:carboxymethylenebutenolidase
MVATEEVGWTHGDVVLRGFLAHPGGSTPPPGLVVVPDVRGLYDHFRDVARRFAAEGFATLAVDLYSREGAPSLPDMPSVMAFMAALPDARVLGDLRSAVGWLASRDDVGPRVGITGFCMGGQYAIMAGCRVPGLAACVSWYGLLRYPERTPHKPESPLDMAVDLACPYLGLFGADDALVPRSDVDDLRHALRAAGKDAEIVTYPGAGHAFFNDSRPDGYRPEAARDAFARAVAFLHRHLD